MFSAFENTVWNGKLSVLLSLQKFSQLYWPGFCNVIIIQVLKTWMHNKMPTACHHFQLYYCNGCVYLKAVEEGGKYRESFKFCRSWNIWRGNYNGNTWSTSCVFFSFLLIKLHLPFSSTVDLISSMQVSEIKWWLTKQQMFVNSPGFIAPFEVMHTKCASSRYT